MGKISTAIDGSVEWFISMADKKRICTIVCDITSGGVESVLLNYFSHMDCSAYDLDLVTYDISSELCAEKFRKLGFRIIVVPPKRKGFKKSVQQMGRVIRDGKYDVVHAHLTEWNCIPMFLAWKHGVEVRISHSHMADFPCGLKRKALFAVQKMLNRIFANKYCACGEDAAKYLYGEKMYRNGHVQVLNNAIDVQKFEHNVAVRKEVRGELGIGESTLCVGHIGRFLEQKNHTFLIDIFAELVKLHPDSCLLLMGMGELEEKIREKVVNLKLTEEVRFLGVRNDPERIYQAMDVFCLPSLYEGLPVVGIEVQAAKVPCVMSDRVSSKVKITPLITMLGLECSSHEWAQALIQSARVDTSRVSFPEEYNIAHTCSQWADLYGG